MHTDANKTSQEHRWTTGRHAVRQQHGREERERSCLNGVLMVFYTVMHVVRGGAQQLGHISKRVFELHLVTGPQITGRNQRVDGVRATWKTSAEACGKEHWRKNAAHILHEGVDRSVVLDDAVLDDAVFTARLKVDHATRKQKLALSLSRSNGLCRR